MFERASLRSMLWLFAGVMLTLAGAVQADPNWRENGNSKAATEAEQCVRETDWMRRNHMVLIQHDRDLTVHQGLRNVDGSLSACVACHANKDEQGNHIAITDPGEFCAGCHAFTGVSVNCFQCHATVPDAQVPEQR